MKDILFQSEGFVFSCRVAGVCVKNGMTLLQKPTNDTAFAFPGGQASLGETNRETLVREFMEELGAEVKVGGLRWVGELFFPWGDRRCHQLCLYYDVDILSPHIPESGTFTGIEKLPGRDFEMEFHWVPEEKLGELELYPPQAAEYIRYPGKVEHFVYRED